MQPEISVASGRCSDGIFNECGKGLTTTPECHEHSPLIVVPSATKASTIRSLLITQRWRSFRSILTGTRRRKTPSGWSRSIVKSGVEKQLATLDPPPDSILAGRISLPPDGNRLAASFVCQHGKIYMLEGFDESTSWLDIYVMRGDACVTRESTAPVAVAG
jgi:hypothetical protein